MLHGNWVTREVITDGAIYIQEQTHLMSTNAVTNSNSRMPPTKAATHQIKLDLKGPGLLAVK